MKMKITEAGRKHLYLTRQMLADGDDVNIEPQSVDAVRALGYAEDVVVEEEEPEVPAVTPKRRGRPPKSAAAVAPVAAPVKEEMEPEVPSLEERTVPELREMAEERGVELPSGYVTKDELVDLVGAADDEDDGA